MIFWLALIAFVVFLVLAIVFEDSWDYGCVGVVSMAASCISGIAVLFMLIAIVICHIGIEVEIEANRQRYDSLGILRIGWRNPYIVNAVSCWVNRTVIPDETAFNIALKAS